jgi:hypothetical protein
MKTYLQNLSDNYSWGWQYCTVPVSTSFPVVLCVSFVFKRFHKAKPDGKAWRKCGYQTILLDDEEFLKMSF